MNASRLCPCSFGSRGLCGITGWIFWSVTCASMILAVAMAWGYAPEEATMGAVQKIFYLHLPVAIFTFLSCMVVCIASVGYLWHRKLWWDDLALAAAKVAVLYCSIVLLTGMIWGHSAWGQWWTWSPRLSFSLVLWVLYVVYLMIRPSIESAQRRAVVCAVYGLAAFLDVPLVYLSVRLMRDIHPTSVELAPAMKLTLLVWFIPITLLTVGLITTRFHLAQLERTQNEPEESDDEQTAAFSSGISSATQSTGTQI